MSVALPAVLLVALAAAMVARPAAAAPVPAAAVAAACVNGMADIYPCRNVDLLSNLPLASMGGGSGSGGWGWTDPSNGKEYAIAARSNGTAFVDISNPTNPVYLGNLPSATGTSSWRELWVHNNTVYIVSDSNGAHGMQVFDLTRLRSVTNPPVTFTANARDTSFSSAHTININPDSGFAYVNGSNTCSGGPRMFNLANRLAPAFAGCVSGDGYSHDSQAVIYHGPDTRFTGRELLVGSNEDTVTVFDVTTKSSPTQLSRTGYAGRGYTHQGWFTEDQRFFLLDDETDETSFGHNTRTYVFNMSSLTSPVLVGSFTGPTTASDHNQYVKGNFSYQANYRAGLRIIDLTNVATPSAMSEAGFFDVDPTSNARGFAGAWTNYPYYPSGNVAVFSIQRGLFVVKPSLTNQPPPETVFSDTFETAAGWTTNPNGTDTATTGAWERGDPEQTDSSGVKQLGTTVSGVNDLVTGRLAGTGAGSFDIDGGTTSIRSPVITLPATGSLTLSLSWYLAHGSNSSSADFFRVSVVGSGTTVLFTQSGAATNRNGAWGSGSWNISGFAGQSVRVLIEAADASTASLVEAGVDNVTITRQ
jgi:choice-of-anchor B domain-containing protein